MSLTTQALESAALLLPPEERARLAERLLASLDIDPEIEAAWAAEVEKRLAEVSDSPDKGEQDYGFLSRTRTLFSAPASTVAHITGSRRRPPEASGRSPRRS